MRKNRPLEEKDFTGGGILGQSSFIGSTGDEAMDARVHELVQSWDCDGHEALIEELLVTALRLGKDDIGAADLKLINRTLKEMRVSSRVFDPYADARKVAVYGSARTTPDLPEFKAARAFAHRMREHGFMSITGAGDGIMGAAQEGAGRDQSFGLNIRLPFEQSANETIRGDAKLIDYNYFFTRKLAFVKESDAAALFPGGFGTMDECFEVLTLIQTGKASVFPVVMVDVPGGDYWETFERFVHDQLLRRALISPQDLNLFTRTCDLDEAVEAITGFYRVFHSYRFVRDRLVIRLMEELPRTQITELNREFSDLVASGEIEQGKALPEEANDEAIHQLPRLIFHVNRGKAGRMRQLIDRINSFNQ